jgi:hypothetical protein
MHFEAHIGTHMCASAIPLADKGVPDLPLSCITQLHFGAVPDLQRCP